MWMVTKNIDSSRCWICGSLADSKEHRIKRSDIVSKYGNGSYKGHDELIILSSGQERIIQGSKSNLLKYNKNLCANCNNTKTQPFDKAYSKFIDYFNKHKIEVSHKRFIDFSKVYDNNFEEGQRNLYKYLVKSFACRLAHFGHPIPKDMIELLDIDNFKTALILNFSINEDKLHFGNLDNDLSNIIGNGDIYTNQSFVDGTGEIESYRYSEFYDYLTINYSYNCFVDGNLGSTWVADSQFIYLGSFYSNLTDEMRQEMHDKVIRRKYEL